MLALIAAYTFVVVVLAVVSGKGHSDVFWTTVVLMTLFALWLGRRAWVIWQRARSAHPAPQRDT